MPIERAWDRSWGREWQRGFDETGFGTAGATASITAPSLDWDDETEDDTPDFNIDFGSAMEIGDVIRLQVASDAGFTADLTETTNTLDSGEVLSSEIDQATGALADGTWYARARVERGGDVSLWSNTETVTISTFDPTDLSANRIWLDASDLSNMKQETTGASATTAATVDSVVGSVFNKGTGGGWAVAPSDAARPILRESSGIYWLEFDGIDDELNLPISGHTSTEAAIVMGLDTGTDDDFMVLVGDSVSSERVIVASETGSPSDARIHAGSGSPTMRVDGAAETPANRGQMHTALSGGKHVATLESADLSSWTTIDFSGFTDANWHMEGDLYQLITNNAAFTGTERADIEAFVAGRTGVTL